MGKNAEVQLSESNALIPQVKMGVEAREQIMGADGLEDVKRTKPDHPLVKYAEVFTHNFDLIAERKSVVYHLRDLAKASIMAKFLLDTEVEIDQFWFDFAAEAKPICCLEVPQLWNDHFRSDQTGTRVYGGVQFGLDRFSLAQTRAGAPMARAASLSATMMRAPTGVRAGISATLRAPGISAALGARAGISATSLAPSVFPQAFRAAPGALRTARGVDLNLDQFDLAQTRAGAPMARAASLSATMMRAPTGVRAGISAPLRAPGISAALGARAGIPRLVWRHQSSRRRSVLLLVHCAQL